MHTTAAQWDQALAADASLSAALTVAAADTAMSNTTAYPDCGEPISAGWTGNLCGALTLPPAAAALSVADDIQRIGLEYSGAAAFSGHTRAWLGTAPTRPVEVDPGAALRGMALELHLDGSGDAITIELYAPDASYLGGHTFTAANAAEVVGVTCDGAGVGTIRVSPGVGVTTRALITQVRLITP